MNKLLFILFAIPFILGGCTSESSAYYSVETEKKVRFNVGRKSQENENSSVLVETVATFQELSLGKYIQYVVYKEDGSVLLNKYAQSNGNIASAVSFEEKIPVGTLSFAVIEAEKLSSETPVLIPENYNTDYCIGNTYGEQVNDNLNIYFDTFTYNLQPCLCEREDDAVLLEADLQPMWSMFEVEIVAEGSYYLPEWISDIILEVKPYSYGFSIRDGITTKQVETSVADQTYTSFPSGSRILMADFRDGARTLTCAVSEVSKTTVSVGFYQIYSSEEFYLYRKDIVYEGSISQNNTYKINLSLPLEATSENSTVQ